MSGFSIYAPARSELVRTASHAFTKKARKRAGFPEQVVRSLLLEDPRMIRTLECRILTDELSWRDVGFPMYFLDTPELVDMLWRAKVDVRVEDLALDTFPRAFSIAWPECKVEGVQPRGCLVWWGTGKDWIVAIRKFERTYLDKGVFGSIQIESNDDVSGIHMSYQKEDATATKFGCRYAYYRASIPAQLIQQGLASDKDFEANFSVYQNPHLFGVSSLTPEETHIQYVTFKLVMRMMVYMRACPEFVREGFPGGKNRKAFEGRWDDFKPIVIESPTRLTGGTHDSPVAHLRTWYFRSYPVKKDGTRKDGVVFVRATVVNAEVDPVTVEDGGAIDGDGT